MLMREAEKFFFSGVLGLVKFMELCVYVCEFSFLLLVACSIS